ncbi:nucleoside-diphosphate-sugar epimerase [Homoserinimonas aerilata]|uniref:Nucleoside-diphosphate-sugar epimerase n=1 Tax=Homoserinimonas aerilata TaxID=1162970 RepID=A0A542YKK1_9MICO|nr:SDR family oxidoreductase [Homoserinimonas aerilata]TQL48623.1 nucleoside-diphosphate-sugar epimerase [Homoserinimonas aerilata]
MRILVTGGSGRLGRNLQASVRRDSTTTWDFVANARGSSRSGPGFLDVTDETAVHDHIAATRPDVVVHLASLAGPVCNDDRDRTFAVNTDAVRNLAEATSALGVGRLIFASTGAVYGDKYSVPASEHAAISLNSWYAESKYQAEQAISEITANAPQLSAIVLRIFNIYGWGFDQSLVSRLWDSQSVPVVLKGMDNFSRDYTHVSSATDAILAATTVTVTDPTTTLNVGSGVALSNRDLTQLLGANRPLHFTVEDGEYSYSCANIDAAKRILGLSPLAPTAVSLAQALR